MDPITSLKGHRFFQHILIQARPPQSSETSEMLPQKSFQISALRLVCKSFGAKWRQGVDGKETKKSCYCMWKRLHLQLYKKDSHHCLLENAAHPIANILIITGINAISKLLTRGHWPETLTLFLDLQIRPGPLSISSICWLASDCHDPLYCTFRSSKSINR